ncbi:MAG: hypothetical protein JXI43_09770 [Tissierellales bacterium]|nr:hypothetical protein [Tissierellales bacterium]
MMKQLILHIGMPKTGTTSIQEMLYKNGRLLREFGVYYPSCLHHHNLKFAPLFKKDSKKSAPVLKRFNVDIDALFDSLTKDWNQVIDTFQEGQMIISSETLYFYNLQDIKMLHDFLDQRFDSVKILAYVRPVESLIPSRIQQEIKQNFFNNDIEGSLQFFKNISHYGFINDWADLFGKENMIVRPFVKNCLKSGDVIEDFFESIGRSDFNIKSLNYQKMNDSLGKNAILFLEKLNKRYPVLKNNEINVERGFAKKDLPLSIYRNLDDEKFMLDFGFSKEEAEKINQDIDRVNVFLDSSEKFDYVQAKDHDEPLDKQLSQDFLVKLLNGYHLFLDDKLTELEKLERDNQQRTCT